MRPDNNGLKIALVGWLGVCLSIASIFSAKGNVQMLFYLALFPLLLSLLFVFTKRATYGVLYLILLFFGHWTTLLHAVWWKKTLLIAIIVTFVYGITLAKLTKKPK